MSQKRSWVKLHTSNFKVFFQRLSQYRSLFIAPLIAILIITLRLTGFLQLLEWATFDQFVRFRPLEAVDPRIVIVTIDEPDLHHVGQWPIPDQVLAKLIQNINKQKPTAIGLDLYRDLPVQPGHEELVQVFKSTPNLIGVEKVVKDGKGAAVAPPAALQEKGQVAAADLVWDADGKIRRALLSVRPENRETILNLGLRLALMVLETKGITPEITESGEVKLGQGLFTRFTGNDGGYVRADAGGYQILLNYRGPLENFQTISMTDVLEGKIPSGLMGDRLVLIGPIAQSLNDLFFTPYSSTFNGSIEGSDRTPGVIIHANIASQILNTAIDGRPLIQVWSEKGEGLWILMWSVVGVVLAGYYRTTRLTASSLFIAGISIPIIAYLAFLKGWWIPVISPIWALSGAGIAMTGYIANLERQDRQVVMSLFARYVTPKIAETIWLNRHELLDHGQFVGQKMMATVLFTDLKGFSTIAENMEPALLMSWLNEYMDTMAQIVLKYDGIVDKFMGDAVMAVFGVPIPRTTRSEIAKDAISAVSCALEMGEQLRSLNQKWRSQGKPTVSMRVGIATGIVVTGSIGSRERMDYTTLGDSVNVAARLEAYDKTFYQGICRILMSEETYRYIQDHFPTRLIGCVNLKGRQQSMNIYQALNESL